MQNSHMWKISWCWGHIHWHMRASLHAVSAVSVVSWAVGCTKTQTQLWMLHFGFVTTTKRNISDVLHCKANPQWSNVWQPVSNNTTGVSARVSINASSFLQNLFDLSSKKKRTALFEHLIWDWFTPGIKALRSTSHPRVCAWIREEEVESVRDEIYTYSDALRINNLLPLHYITSRGSTSLTF